MINLPATQGDLDRWIVNDALLNALWHSYSNGDIKSFEEFLISAICVLADSRKSLIDLQIKHAMNCPNFSLIESKIAKPE